MEADPLVSVAAWEAAQPGEWPDFPEVCEALRGRLGGGRRLFYVCGADHAARCGLGGGMGEVGVVVVPRGAAGPPPPAEQPARGVFVASPARGEAAAFSSTLVREALAERDFEAASRYLSPAVAQLMLRPTAEHLAAFEADYRQIGIVSENPVADAPGGGGGAAGAEERRAVGAGRKRSSCD